jgi:acetyl esterase
MALDEATSALLKQMAESGAKPLHEMTPEEAHGFGVMLRGPMWLGSRTFRSPRSTG